MGHLLESLLPAGKELLTTEDLITSGLYDNIGQIQRAVDNGLPGLKLAHRSTKFHRGAVLAWLHNQQTQSRKTKKHLKQDSEASAVTEPVVDEL